MNKRTDELFYKYGHGEIKIEYPSNILFDDSEKKGWSIFPKEPTIPVDQVKPGGKFTMYTEFMPKSVRIDKETTAEIRVTKSVPMIVTKVRELKRKHKLIIKAKRDANKTR